MWSQSIINLLHQIFPEKKTKHNNNTYTQFPFMSKYWAVRLVGKSGRTSYTGVQIASIKPTCIFGSSSFLSLSIIAWGGSNGKPCFHSEKLWIIIYICWNGILQQRILQVREEFNFSDFPFPCEIYGPAYMYILFWSSIRSFATSWQISMQALSHSIRILFFNI